MILRAERYLKLDVAGRQARMVVSLTLGPDEGRRVLSAADGDGDGRVTAEESEAYLSQWGAALVSELPLSVDAAPIAPTWGDGFLEPTGAVRATPLTVEMVARFELAGGEQTVTIVDRMVRREVFERTDVAFDVRDGAELVASGIAGEADGPTPDLMYGGTFRPGEPVSLVATLRTPPPEVPPGSPPWALIAVAGVALVAGFGLLTWLRRRR